MTMTTKLLDRPINKRELHRALRQFRNWWFEVSRQWDDMELAVGQPHYPFNRSFDELDIPDWVNSITDVTYTPSETFALDDLDAKIDLSAGYILLTQSAFRERAAGARVTVNPLLFEEASEGENGVTWIDQRGRRKLTVLESAKEVVALVGRYQDRIRERDLKETEVKTQGGTEGE